MRILSNGSSVSRPSAVSPYWLSIGAAALAFTGSVVSLTGDAAYEGLTDAFLPQAIAQDITNLVLVSPLLVVSALGALRGSVRARILWLGTTAFTAYSYVIYAFSIPFGPLFLLWVAVLALSLFALIGGSLSTPVVVGRTSARALVTAAWVVIGIAVLFLFLWLSEDVPALIDGTAQRSAIEMAVPTNVVHVLDYAFFLPAAIATAVLLLRRDAPFARVATPAFLVFLLLTCVPILITPSVARSLGIETSWGVLVPIGVLVVILLGPLVWVLQATEPDRHPFVKSLEDAIAR